MQHGLLCRIHEGRFFAVLLCAGALAVLAIVAACSTTGEAKTTQTDLVKRGEYLVTVGGCHDCHSPKVMVDGVPHPDPKRLLSGHPASETMPPLSPEPFDPHGWMVRANLNITAWAGPWGISYAANLTPHQVTGSGAWTEESFIKAMRTGKHLGAGRPILPPMPWQNLSTMPEEDLKAIFAYIKSLPAIDNMVPQPVPPVTAQ